MNRDDYETLTMTWRRIAITVRHNPNWMSYDPDCKFYVTHTEILRDDGLALPITETGYRSHFMDDRHLKEYDGILDYVRQWLDHEAKSKKWKAIEADQNQLKLF